MTGAVTEKLTELLTEQQLTGQSDSHLLRIPSGHKLQAQAALAFETLREDARRAGFELEIASSFRSFERQRDIWNGKARGERPVHDDDGNAIVMQQLPPRQRVHAIMRFSALPGSSRHHWGTDLDVFDAGAIPKDYRLQLSPVEVAPGGMFDPLHTWLDERIAGDNSQGFFRPYSIDRNGVAPERWHLSYAPLSALSESACDVALLETALSGGDIELWEEVQPLLDELFARYIAPSRDWCPAHYHP